ncbi:hypothetical protein C1H46_024335 [Malus baccata]|uniref:Uncharacterized protein n=1 Tax=Malus baccata TaxID=106549 RepID=A0A540LUE9_MALBA|nr:hypothetical protein C1H46_024335 [Malus baccata]
MTEEAKKSKPKKPKKPKVTVAEAAAKIDEANDLEAFLIDISASYESKEDIQLMRFADYFGRAFSAVSASQFPWVKMFKESSVAKLADIPLSHISETVYKTSVDWINQRSIEALGSFILWSLESILADLASQVSGTKGKKAVQNVSSKSQVQSLNVKVAIFVVVAMVLRRRPDVLISILPTLRENSKYQGQDKLPVTIWMIVQASQGDLAVALHAWARNVLPLVCGKSSNPQSRDLVLQLVERILSMPKARTILVNSAVRKGERLVPPSALEILMGVTFPAHSARVKATERFEAIYPTLKAVALAGAPGSKAMKQVSQQMLSFAVKAAGESIPELSDEAAGIFIWCLTQHADCFKQWDKVYEENLEASVAVLKKLSNQWKEHSANLSPFDPMREALKSFSRKNEKALAGEAEDARQEKLNKEADKYCKTLLGKISRGSGCKKTVALAVVALAVGAAVMSPNVKEQAICTLWNLSVDEKFREKIANSDVLPLLVKSVDDEDIKVKEAAGGVLANLALNDILKSNIPLHNKDWFAACLVKLGSLSRPRLEFQDPINMEVTLHQTIPRLVEQLKTSFVPEEKEAAVVELNRIISEGVVDSTRAIASEGGIFLLVKLIEEGSERAIEASLAILYNLSMDSENHSAIVVAGAVPVLRRIVLSQRPQWNRALHLLRTLPT